MPRKISEKGISPAVIKRLPRYYRYLGELLEQGIERISSSDLSARMHVTASQIRQDLNQFGGFGQQGYGYHVEVLHKEIGHLLGLDRIHHVILIGVGNLGKAIANHVRFERISFRMTGLFDVDPNLTGKIIGGLPVRSMAELDTFIASHDVDIAALTVPKDAAEEIAMRLVDLGIKAFWNFAHIDLEMPADIVVENVHLSASLMRLSYRLRGMGDEDG